ncbi:MAG: thiolase domain-containing protein [Chloroflexota bacterium]|nr:thiolase domain-containing protein [Chloroflexota bacterium]
MREVAVIGIGQTSIGEWWDLSLREMAAQALRNALDDAGIDRAPDSLFVANMLAARVSSQAHLATLVADFMGWYDIEATTVEAACASGGMAFQAGLRAVASGMVDLVAVCGVEKMTDATPQVTTAALATAADADYEAIHGATFVGLNALIMRRYMHEYSVPHEAFAPFSINAHRNAANNPNAMFKNKITPESYARAPMIAEPINLFDSAPICDGAAAMLLCPLEMARDLSHKTPIRILASAAATDTIAIADRRDPLALQAARTSAKKAYDRSGLAPDDMDVFELHDAFSIMAALSLEAAGFAERGRGIDLAQNGDITLGGRVPICTMGGLKGRGHPVGATGVYELVDLVTQLRGEAGANQVQDAEIGMAQNIGGSGATIVTHILSR